MYRGNTYWQTEVVSMGSPEVATGDSYGYL